MEQPWLAHYPPNVAASIDCNAYASLLPLFTETCQRFTHEIAYENFGTPLSYQELYDNSTHLAAYFQSLGLSPGARIAIMMPNLLQYPIAIFAILRAGFVVTNINPLYTPYELANQLNDSGAEVLIVLDHFAHTVQAALPHISVKQVLITQLGDYFPTWKRWLSQLMMQYFKKMIPAYQIPTAQTWRNALQEGRSKPFTHFEAQHDTLAFLQYTGGTTGISKAAMLTHKNILANLLQATEWISPIGLDHTDIAVTALPMYHIFSLTANCLVFLKIGAKNILITNPRDISHFIKTIRKAGFTTITGVNTLFNTLLHHPDFDKIDFSHL
ncbi:MAG: AMP-binding protein, partial [Legionellaceae bacterium]|nr:AMP-binding protein [Legionellaceae bacterium]